MARLTNAALVDRFAELQALKADLAKEEKTLKEQIEKRAKRDADGLLFLESEQNRITVSYTAPGMAINSKKAKEMLPAKLFDAICAPRAGSVRFNCKARVSEAA